MNFAGQPQFPWLQAKYDENEIGQETPPSSSDEGPEPNPAEFIRNPQPALPRAANQPKRWPPQQQQKPSAWSVPRKQGWGQQNSRPRSAQRGRGVAQKRAVPMAAPQAPPPQLKSSIVPRAPPSQSKPAVMLRALAPQSNPVRRSPPQPKPSYVPRAPPERKTAAVRGSQRAVIPDGAKANPWTVRRNVGKQNAWARRGNSQQQRSPVGNSQRASPIPGPPKAKPSQQRAASLRQAQPQPRSQSAVIPDLQGKLETARMENQRHYQPAPIQQPVSIVNEQKYQQLAPPQPSGMVNQPLMQDPAFQRPVRMVRQPYPQFASEQVQGRGAHYAQPQVSQRHHLKGSQQPLKAVIYAEGNTLEGVSEARKRSNAQRLQAVVPDLSGTPEGAVPEASRAPVGDRPLHTTSEGCSTWVDETGCHCKPTWRSTSNEKEQE